MLCSSIFYIRKFCNKKKFIIKTFGKLGDHLISSGQEVELKLEVLCPYRKSVTTCYFDYQTQLIKFITEFC